MNSAGYGGSAPQGYEAPACVQNAMVSKDKKPFTYTPGGLDLSQIKSERMAKRLARNAQAEGASGVSQQNRPQQPQSPGGSSSAASQIGAAGMGMPFQVLPPSPTIAPSTAAGKKMNGTSAPPPPPPPSSSSTLAPPQKGSVGGSGSAPGSPNMQRKSLTPQRFEPPPMGFRPEIKIPPNPMAALRKVPPPVEKNTFWKDEYKAERSKSPIAVENDRVGSPDNVVVAAVASNGTTAAAAGNGISSEPTPVSLSNGNNHVNTNNNHNNNHNDNENNEQVDGYKKRSIINQQPEIANNRSNNSTQAQESPKSPENNSKSPPLPATTPPQEQSRSENPPQPSPISETRNMVASSPSPATNLYARQTDSPRSETSTPPQRATDSPFRYGGGQHVQQQQSLQQRAAATTISPLAQPSPPPPQTQSPKPFMSSPTAGMAGTTSPTSTNNSPNSQPMAQTVPWRTQRTAAQQQPSPPQSQLYQQPQSPSLYNNVSTQQNTQQTPVYQGPKPTNVGSLYIAPLAQPTEPQAPSVVRQFQQQQQQQQRESPMRQMPQQQQPQYQPQQQYQSPPQQQQQSQPLRSNVPWMSTKPKVNDQPEWVRPEENGNVVPSSLHRIKSPPPPTVMQQSQLQQQQQPTQQYQPQPFYQQQQPIQQQQSHFYGYQPDQGNGYAAATGGSTATPTNFGTHHGVGNSGLRLQINVNSNANSGTTNQQSGPRERIIPIQLEQTPTGAPSQPNFNVSYGGISTAPSNYVVRSPNQFVDQGYNNYPTSNAGAQQPSYAAVNAQRVMSPTQQLNAPRIVQQQQQFTGANGNRSRIIPIAMESGTDGTRGPISSSPIVLQNDPRSSPIQSKSFRILQKITDTIDNGNGGDDNNAAAESQVDAEPQLQRPQYARQMSAQQARQQPNVEQMRRMHITPDAQQQQQHLQSHSPQAWNQDMSHTYIHPSEQQVPEPKKYTGSAIPSRSFKILQAMTTPENAGPGQSDL